MKLLITRDQAQKKGFLSSGAIEFELRARVELTNEEAELVKKYAVAYETLVKRAIKLPVVGDVNISITINSLIKGETFTGKNIATILTYEDNVKEACRNFKNYLEVMKQFGGEEVTEY